MPWMNRNGFPYSQLGITMNAWEASGVYGLYKEQQWIYIGETGDMRGRLLEHLGGDHPRIVAAMPTYFSYELHPAFKRVARQDALILELRPLCNARLG